MSDKGNFSPPPRNVYYPIMIVVGIAGNVVSAFSNLQAIYSTFGIFFSTLLIGVGVIGFFVNQRRISLRDGIMYAIIWTMLMALAGAGYYILISRESSVYGIVLDNATTRNPVSNLEVSLYLYSSGATNHVRTNSTGEFKFDGVSDGQFDVIINDISIYSGDTPSILRKLIDTNVNTGRFYLYNIISSSVPPSPTPQITFTPTIPTISTSTATTQAISSTPSAVVASQTPRPTNTLRPPTSTLTPIPSVHLLVDEDFNDNFISAWTDESGEWGLTYIGTNAVYRRVQGDAGWAELEIGEPGWLEYSVEFDISTLDMAVGGKVFINTHQSSADSRVILAIDFTDQTLQLIEFSGSSSRILTEPTNVAFQEGEWTKIQIAIQNHRVRVLVNNRQQLSVTLSDHNFRGQVWFRSPNSSILFDNIRVWTLENVFIPTSTPTPRPPTSTPTAIPTQQLLVSESFDDRSISAWTDEANEWEITYIDSNAIYHRREGENGWVDIAIGNTDWSNYTVEFDISSLNVASMGRVYIHTYETSDDRKIILWRNENEWK